MHSVLTQVGLFVLRVALSAAMFLGHGIGKIQKYSEMSQNFPDPLGIGSQFSLLLAIFAEVICSVLVALGLLTRLAVIPLVTTMLVAWQVVHAQDDWGTKELAVIYLIGFTTILFTGSGKLSVDHILWKRWKGRREQRGRLDASQTR